MLCVTAQIIYNTYSNNNIGFPSFSICLFLYSSKVIDFSSTLLNFSVLVYFFIFLFYKKHILQLLSFIFFSYYLYMYLLLFILKSIVKKQNNIKKNYKRLYKNKKRKKEKKKYRVVQKTCLM